MPNGVSSQLDFLPRELNSLFAWLVREEQAARRSRHTPGHPFFPQMASLLDPRDRPGHCLLSTHIQTSLPSFRWDGLTDHTLLRT